MLLTEKDLRRDLYQLGLNQTEIAQKHDCSRKTVKRRIDDYDLPIFPSLKRNRREDGRVRYRMGDSSFFEYQLTAIASGADPNTVFGGDHVHHINGCTFDGRPENLISLTPEEHGLVEKTDFEVDKDERILYKELE